MALPLCGCCTGARSEHACRQSLLGLLGSIKKKVQLSLPMACMFILFFVRLPYGLYSSNMETL